MTSWRDSAACLDSDADFFGTSASSKREAKAVCADCPVRQECLDFAMRVEVNEDTGVKLSEDRRFGVYGGLTRNERWELDYPDRAEQQRKRDRASAAARYAEMTPQQRTANRGSTDTEHARELKRRRDRNAYERRLAALSS